MPTIQHDTLHAEFTRLQDIFLEQLQRVVPRHSPIALVDFPDHSNVGDSAIWLGEILALNRLGWDIRYVASMKSFAEQQLRRAMPSGTVLIHGGGNFGSIWPAHQAHREEMLGTLRDYTLVQLPQSLHFGEDLEGMAQAARLIAAHPAFTLMVRDKPSQAVARQLGCEPLLAPDAAVFLWGQLARKPPDVDVYSLQRSDKESTGPDWSVPPKALNFAKEDWVSERKLAWAPLHLELQRRAHGRFGALPFFQKFLLMSFNRMAWDRVERGCRQLSRGRTVLTDRLHAHLLCDLLQIPHVVADNHYGKIHGYMDCWGDFLGTRCTSDQSPWPLLESLRVAYAD